jgi:LuxR family maltose regulon positive regulatory protein
MYRLAEQSIPQKGGEHRGAWALVEAGLADVHYEWNDLGAALAHLEQGLNLMPWWGKADDFALTYLTLGRIRLAQANLSGALEAVEKATQAIRDSGVFCEAQQAVEYAQVRLWLAGGDLAAANRWAASQEERLRSDGHFGFDNELAQIALARVYLAQARPTEASALLAQLEAQSRSAGRMGRALEITLLRALALKRSGDSKGAHLALAACLEQAEPEGYVRLFLDEGRPVQALLAEWLAHSDGGALRAYAGRLLSQFEPASQAIQLGQGRVSPVKGAAASMGEALVEPLSQREMEVLRIIATGSTNREIARQLVVSPGTVKAHTASIYRKLDVANRTEAVARARQLGILP